MIELLSRIFIRNRENTQDPGVRSAWGTLCSVVTICLNILLFAGKYITGMLSGSVAIMADSFNNLSDAGSSVMILLGFKFAGIKPTEDRPFGHGRIEYIVAMAVSVMIILVGVSSFREAVQIILHPEPVSISVITFVILLVSIAVKLYMAFYGTRIAERIGSLALKASARENISDTISTFLALVSIFVSYFFAVNIDGYAAIIVSCILLWSGIQSGWETLKQLLGKKADPELVSQIHDIVMSYDEIIGMHDLVVHDYGPGRLYISLHCEVPGDRNVYELHDAMDRAMLELDGKLHCESIIHMDPVNRDDGVTEPMRKAVSAALTEKLDPAVMIHDFRVIPGPTHTNVVFDAVIPHRFRLTDEEAKTEIQRIVRELFDHPTNAVVTIDKPYA